MEKHITVVAILNIVFGVMGSLLTCLGSVAVWGFGMAVTNCCIRIVVPPIALFLIILFELEIIGGIGLLVKPSPWMKLWVMKLPIWITL